MNNKATNIALQRLQLDRKLKRLRAVVSTQPRQGWLRTIRTALGMTAQQLAERLGVTRQAIASYEKDEQAGAITIATLRKVAEVLDCQLAISLVPKTSLEKNVKHHALKAAERIVRHTDLHMKMEDQGTAALFQKQQVHTLADELVRKMDKRIWEPIR